MGPKSFTETAPFTEERDEDIVFNLQDKRVNTLFSEGKVVIVDKPLKPGIKKKVGIFGIKTETKTAPRMPMREDNILKIAAGTKTTTIRTEQTGKQEGIPVGETRQREIGGDIYNVTNRGFLTIAEAGGLQAMLKSEDVAGEEFFKFEWTKKWVKGIGRMYVYDIRPINEKGEDPITCK
jgi:hypothetical protein